MKLRLLVCHDCQSIEVLPDFKGNPRDDVLLEEMIKPHRFPNGEEHIGALCDVEETDWNDPERRSMITSRIGRGVKPGEGEGVGSEFYATKDTFREDALKCYSEHNRPKQGCIDWQDDRKRLGNPTSEGWKRGPKVYLCAFCPCASWVRTQIRIRKGAYDAK